MRWHGAPFSRLWIPWAVSAGAAFAILLARDFRSWRGGGIALDLRASVSWGTAFLLETGLLSPFLSGSRLAPALLYPAYALLLSPTHAALCGLAVLGWLSWVPGNPWPSWPLAASQGILAALWTLAALAVKSRIAPGISPPGARSPEDSREGPDPVGGGGIGTAETAQRRIREEMGEGIRRVLEGILPLTGADAAVFVSRGDISGRHGRADWIASRGEAPGCSSLEVPDPYGPVQEAIVLCRPFFAEGEAASPHRVRRRGRSVSPDGVAAVPVELEGRVEGALLGLRFGESGWTDPVVPVLEMGGFFIAREIAAARRTRRDALAAARQEALNGLVRTIATAAECAEEGRDGEPFSTRGIIYRETVVRMREHIGADRVFLVEIDESGTSGRIAAAEGGTGAPERTDPGREGVPRAEGPAGVPPAAEPEADWTSVGGTYLEWVFGKQVHRIFTGLGDAPPRHSVLPGSWSDPLERSCLLVPAGITPGFRGILVCGSRGRAFRGADADAASEILRIMRMGLSHALQVETLAAQATTDGLTGLLNQRSFRTRLSRVLERIDGRHPAAVVMLDLDHFKKINDVFGHAAGDEVLRRTAAAVRKTIRKSDFAGRYGGEEFAVFLSQADRDHAARAAERLLLVIRKSRIVLGAKEIGVTASLGVACHPGDGRTAEELLGKADLALYRSKRDGRDRVSFA